MTRPSQCMSNKNRTLKADTKTVLSTIAAFLTSISPEFDANKLSVENLPELYRLLKHPGNVNKNIFNPVGAKHTWWQCLSVIKWLGQLAHYSMDTHEFV